MTDAEKHEDHSSHHYMNADPMIYTCPYASRGQIQLSWNLPNMKDAACSHQNQIGCRSFFQGTYYFLGSHQLEVVASNPNTK